MVCWASTITARADPSARPAGAGGQVLSVAGEEPPAPAVAGEPLLPLEPPLRPADPLVVVPLVPVFVADELLPPEPLVPITPVTGSWTVAPPPPMTPAVIEADFPLHAANQSKSATPWLARARFVGFTFGVWTARLVNISSTAFS
jgi:hypothetical protein